MYIKIRYGGWPNISDIIKICTDCSSLGSFINYISKEHKCILLLTLMV